jgi:hypothetical protein
MAQCSYTATDADSSEETLDVTVEPGAREFDLKLEPLNLNVTLDERIPRTEH